MNKEKQQVYNEVLAGVLDRFGLTEERMFKCNCAECVEALGGKVYEKPFYNCYALWVTANMLYSDHAQSVAEDMGAASPEAVPNEKMALSMYRKAVEKLKDVDRQKFVREYFGV